ncbi:retrovirus-related pol polyprotein from transposon TNT 1-94 [Tanacetum coccineum]|uniref:Retrovirus-related pol polyprotein from transposon TNT 1-94 n=1 Tax=Tanacetum coccineum TaxID=301880 RepID=A0ABQ4XZW6_9ASTR
MEQYMIKTRADYGSGIARPKIDDKDSFELKGQFLKELRDNTFSGLDHEDANEHIEKVLEIVDLFHIPNITQDQKMEEINNFHQEPDETLYQACERFKELLMKCPQHYLTEIHEVILFYIGLDVPTRQILDSKGAIPSKTAADVKVAIQEIAEYSQKWHNGTSRTRSTETSNGLAAIQAQLNNLGREIKKVNEKVYAAQVDANNVKDLTTPRIAHSKKKERGFGSLPSSTEANPRDHVKSISNTAKADSNPIRRIGSPQYAEKDPGSFTLPCYINNVFFDNALADLGANVSVMPLSTYLNLGLGELAHTKLTVELADRTVKYPKGIAENMLIILSTVHAKIDVFKRKITLRVGDEKIIFKSVKPASSLIKRVCMLSLRERMGLDLEARLMGETLVLNRSLNPLYGDYIKLNDLNVPLELRRDQVDDLIHTIEEVENMDGYRDQDIGDIIFGESFCKASCVEARRYRHLPWDDWEVDRYGNANLVIMEYLVKISKKARILELKQRQLKVSVLTSYTPYLSRKIRRISAYTSQKTTKEQVLIPRIQRRSIRRI